MNRVAVFFEGKPLTDRHKLSVFRSKAQAYLFLAGMVGDGWSQSHEVRTIWRARGKASARSASERNDAQ